DIGGGAGGAVKGVIGCVGSRQIDAADADGLVSADGFVGKTGAGVAGGEAVATDSIIGQGDGGGGGAVIDFVDARGADAQGAGGDVGGGAGGGVGGVVGRIGAADRDAADADSLGRADVLVGETGAGVAGGETVATEAVVRKGDGGSGEAIIGLIHASGADVEGTGGDIGSGAGGGGSQLIVGGGGATQAQAGGGNGLSGANRFGGEGGGASAENDIRAGEHPAEGAGGDGGDGGAIVNLAIGSDAAGDGGRVDGKGAAQGAGQAGGAGAELLAGAGQTDAQTGESDGAVAGGGADVQRAGALKGAGAGGE